MATFPKKRLQVFISSTYKDLIEERQAAVEAILTHGHIPAGMELFTAGDESQMDVIKQWIDESDVYLLVLGGRYGSIEPNSGKSYTQLEYEYAVEKGKPFFACAVTPEAQEERLKKHGSKVTESENPAKLKAFRSLVTSKMVRFWGDTKDIKITIGETLSKFEKNDSLVGWVRRDQITDASVTNELSRLSKENAELRDQLFKYSNESNKALNSLTFDEIYSMFKNKGLLDDLYENFDSIIESSSSNRFTRRAVENPIRQYLIGLDLISLTDDFDWYELTEKGKVFFSNLQITRLKQTSDKNGRK